MRVVLKATTCPKGELAGNLERHRPALIEAAADGADAVVFPEFSLTGSVSPDTQPEHAIGAHDPAWGAVFGIAERMASGSSSSRLPPSLAR